MIIMNLELDNIYGFKDFKMNFAYPKRIVGSTIAKHCHTYGFIYFSNLNIQSFPFNDSF